MSCNGLPFAVVRPKPTAANRSMAPNAFQLAIAAVGSRCEWRALRANATARTPVMMSPIPAENGNGPLRRPSTASSKNSTPRIACCLCQDSLIATHGCDSRSALADHVRRNVRIGIPVLIGESWYYPVCYLPVLFRVRPVILSPRFRQRCRRLVDAIDFRPFLTPSLAVMGSGDSAAFRQRPRAPRNKASAPTGLKRRTPSQSLSTKEFRRRRRSARSRRCRLPRASARPRQRGRAPRRC